MKPLERIRPISTKVIPEIEDLVDAIAYATKWALALITLPLFYFMGLVLCFIDHMTEEGR